MIEKNHDSSFLQSDHLNEHRLSSMAANLFNDAYNLPKILLNNDEARRNEANRGLELDGGISPSTIPFCEYANGIKYFSKTWGEVEGYELPNGSTLTQNADMKWTYSYSTGTPPKISTAQLDSPPSITDDSGHNGIIKFFLNSGETSVTVDKYGTVSTSELVTGSGSDTNKVPYHTTKQDYKNGIQLQNNYVGTGSYLETISLPDQTRQLVEQRDHTWLLIDKSGSVLVTTGLPADAIVFDRPSGSLVIRLSSTDAIVVAATGAETDITNARVVPIITPTPIPHNTSQCVASNAK